MIKKLNFNPDFVITKSASKGSFGKIRRGFFQLCEVIPAFCLHIVVHSVSDALQGSNAKSGFNNLSRGEKFLMAGFLAVFLPFIILSAFNHASADDYLYATKTLRLGFWQNQIREYTHWGGRYVATALLSINPLVFHSFVLYKVFPLVLFFGLFHALYAFTRSLVGNLLERKVVFWAVLSLLTVYIWGMPSVASGFYWYAAAITYQVANIFTLYLGACVVSLMKARPNNRPLPLVVSSVLLIFAVSGCNETSMVLLLMILFGMLVLSFKVDRQMRLFLIVLFAAAVLAAYFVISAPGNSIRMAYEPHRDHDFLLSIKSSVLYVVKILHRWSVSLPMMVLSLFFVPLASRLASQRIGQGKTLILHPILSIGFFIAFLVGGFFPAFYSLGDLPPHRTINVIYLFFIIGWFLNLYVVVEYFVRRHGAVPPLPKFAVVMMCVFVFLIFLKDDNNIRTAYSDLLSKRAFKYDQQLSDRYKTFARDSADVFEVDPLIDPPKSIFFEDITTSHDGGWNSSYAEYFGKKKITLRNE